MFFFHTKHTYIFYKQQKQSMKYTIYTNYINSKVHIAFYIFV